MQRPVITTDSPGCREPVIDGENGLLVPIKSVQPLAEAMIQLGKDAKLREEMGKRGRAIAEKRYDVHKVNKSILEFLEIGTE
jgi:glycosyltransferase involved in cell wall biosynthesis